MELWPPGGLWIRVEERSLIMFPQFWLLPLAHLFEDSCCFTGCWTGACWTLAGRFSFGAGSLHPNEEPICAVPPPEEERWFCCTGAAAGAAAAGGGAGAGAGAALAATSSHHPKEDPICERPPGGLWMRVEERSLSMLPQFWLAPLAHLLEDSALPAEVAPAPAPF